MPFIDKPPYGSPCNGCGHCCRAEVCPVGAMLFEQEDNCPALTLMDNKYVCGLVAAPAAFFPHVDPSDAHKVSAAVSYLLGAGLGCDARVRGEVILNREAIDKRMGAAYNDLATKAATIILRISIRGR
ncbi:hypothetical protein RCDURKIN_125 [Rhodobacter phage RcDurkin]|nr:hypothetical protein RCDURKIN_125 [Rhodobacter phage RcDurkin]UUV43865.1 hypothetical protein RCKICKAPOO_124 [Rhodobacter phage RcKickapoo]UUV44495.1 hypothetical protein RCMENCHIE_126 [Rhodobacter phage RcMenchie]